MPYCSERGCATESMNSSARSRLLCFKPMRRVRGVSGLARAILVHSACTVSRLSWTTLEEVGWQLLAVVKNKAVKTAQVGRKKTMLKLVKDWMTPNENSFVHLHRWENMLILL